MLLDQSLAISSKDPPTLAQSPPEHNWKLALRAAGCGNGWVVEGRGPTFRFLTATTNSYKAGPQYVQIHFDKYKGNPCTYLGCECEMVEEQGRFT
jgi:hypothetical protein